jgi:hypothetical protein
MKVRHRQGYNFRNLTVATQVLLGRAPDDQLRGFTNIVGMDKLGP